MKDQITATAQKQAPQMGVDSIEESEGGLNVASPPAFQLQATPLHRESQSEAAAPIQREVDAGDIVGNVSSGTTGRGGRLDARSQRRLFERLAQLMGRNAIEEGEAFEALDEAARAEALERAILWFQHSEQGRALIQQITEDNEVSDGDEPLYGTPATGRRSRFTAPRASYREGEVRNNDVTMQALANAWPKMILGRMLEEEDAYQLILRLVKARGLPFNSGSVNVISVRAFQGGEIHDNNEGTSRGAFSRNNIYNDTTYILSESDGVRRVTESRSTVDPGNGTSARGMRSTFRMEADQQWDYSGNSGGRSAKFDRPMYGLANRAEVNRGTYWQEHPEELEAALANGGTGARVISDAGGRRFADVNQQGEANRVSAIHSGGSGGGRGDLVQGDSTGCSVVHGAWFAHFNESLRRAAGSEENIRFTYSLLDLRMFEADELRTIVESI